MTTIHAPASSPTTSTDEGLAFTLLLLLSSLVAAPLVLVLYQVFAILLR